MSVFIIAEAGSSWDCDLYKALKLIDAAKECGADAVKFQWTSDAYKMAQRRQLGLAEESAYGMYKKYLQYHPDFLNRFKEHCDSVGIEFMCTTYLIEDIATIAPLVKRFKVSAFESKWELFVAAHEEFGKAVIISQNPGSRMDYWRYIKHNLTIETLHCISKYPTPLEDVGLGWIKDDEHQGFSDHTANVLTGAAAVAAGARIIESHIRLEDTPSSNPDYPHSLAANGVPDDCGRIPYEQYVSNIRAVERML